MELTAKQTGVGLALTLGLLVAVFFGSPMPRYAVLVVLSSFLVFGTVLFALGVFYGTHRGKRQTP